MQPFSITLLAATLVFVTLTCNALSARRFCGSDLPPFAYRLFIHARFNYIACKPTTDCTYYHFRSATISTTHLIAEKAKGRHHENHHDWP
jgi:hypothetical protein